MSIIQGIDCPINAEGKQATLHPVQVVKRFTDSEQGRRAAFRFITKLVDKHPGEKWGTVVAHYAPIGKVYTGYSIRRIEYTSNVERGWLNDAGEYVVEPGLAFDTQFAVCVVQFIFIEPVHDAESHAHGGHDRARVVGCAECIRAANIAWATGDRWYE